jgi:hypothetical protein
MVELLQTLIACARDFDFGEAHCADFIWSICEHLHTLANKCAARPCLYNRYK